MTDSMENNLRSMAASSAMEGLPLDGEQLQVIKRILNGEISLQDYFSEKFGADMRER